MMMFINSHLLSLVLLVLLLQLPLFFFQLPFLLLFGLLPSLLSFLFILWLFTLWWLLILGFVRLLGNNLLLSLYLSFRVYKVRVHIWDYISPRPILGYTLTPTLRFFRIWFWRGRIWIRWIVWRRRLRSTTTSTYTITVIAWGGFFIWLAFIRRFILIIISFFAFLRFFFRIFVWAEFSRR